MKLIKAIKAARNLTGGWSNLLRSIRTVYRLGGGVAVLENFLNVLRHATISNGSKVTNRFSDLKDHLSWLKSEIDEAIKIDPRVGLMPPEERLGLGILRPLESQLGVALKSLRESLSGKRYTTLVFIPRIGIGGAEKVALRVADSVAKFEGEQVLVVETDAKAPEAFHPGSQSFDLISIARARKDLSQEEALDFCRLLIASLAPMRVINVNSQLCWETFEKFGPFLRSQTSLIVALFCPDFDARGYDRGYGMQFFSTTQHLVDAFLSDNEEYIKGLSDQFQPHMKGKLPRNLHVLNIPSESVEEIPAFVLDEANNRVALAGRMTRQKGVHLLPAIIASLPDIEFHLFGPQSAELKDLIPREFRNRVILHGAYRDPSSIASCEPFLFLNPSQWDGLPNTVVEACSQGIPVASSAIGGLTQFLGGERANGYLVRDPGSPLEFVNAVRQARIDPYGRALKASQSLNFVRDRHSDEVFQSQVRALLDDSMSVFNGRFNKA